MEKTLEIHLKEQRRQLLKDISDRFELESKRAIESNEHTYNDCAVVAKMWLMAAKAVRSYR